MPFSRLIRTDWSADGRLMVVVDEVSFTDKAGRVWTVPAGFETDGASIPHALWALVGSPFTGRYRAAAVFHDCAYRTLGVTKEEGDAMFLEAMLECGCEPWRAELIHEAVRRAGFESYAAAQRSAAATSP